MRLSVYLGEDEIRTALGRAGKRIEIQDCCRIRLKEGALINDVVTEEEAVKAVLTGIRERYGKYRRSVYLTMGGNQIITKVMQVPRMARHHMLQLVKQELSDLILPSEEDSYVYDYSVIRRRNRENKGRTILCVAMKRKVVIEYENLFSECGLKLKAIDVAVDGLNRLVDFLPAFRGKTFILAVADGRNLMTSIYIKGVYTYTNRMRLVEERGKKGCTEEMERVIRSVIHFCRIQKEEFELDFVCICGVSEEERSFLIPRIARSEDIAVILPEPGGLVLAGESASYSIDNYMYVTGNLINGRKSLDLIAAAKRRESSRKNGSLAGIAACLLPAAAAAFFFITASGNALAIRDMNREIRTLEEKLSEPDDGDNLSRSESLEAKLSALKDWRKGQEALEREAGRQPQMYSAIRNRLFEETMDRMELSEPEYADGSIAFDGRASGYEEISDYVRSLEETGMFAAVEYVGFTDINPATGKKDGWYYFHLTCRLKVPA